MCRGGSDEASGDIVEIVTEQVRVDGQRDVGGCVTNAGQLDTVRIGKRRLVSSDAIDDFVDRLTDGAVWHSR